MKLREKAQYVYIMLDRKNNNLALVKAGITSDTLYNRFHCYKTSNPWLELVAVAETRKNQNLKTVEEMFHAVLNENFEHICGEWYKITNENTINEIENSGFKFFGKLNYRIKNKEMINSLIVELW